jgi:hypothetical protein
MGTGEPTELGFLPPARAGVANVAAPVLPGRLLGAGGSLSGTQTGLDRVLAVQSPVTNWVDVPARDVLGGVVFVETTEGTETLLAPLTLRLPSAAALVAAAPQPFAGMGVRVAVLAFGSNARPVVVEPGAGTTVYSLGGNASGLRLPDTGALDLLLLFTDVGAGAEAVTLMTVGMDSLVYEEE